MLNGRSISIAVYTISCLFALSLNSIPTNGAEKNTTPRAWLFQDLTVDAATVLKTVPGVESVQVSPSVGKPTARIIHLRDYHYIPQDFYSIDFPGAAGKPLEGEELKSAYQTFLATVETVQVKEVAFLRCLIKDHGLKEVLVEGLAEEDMEDLPLRLELHRESERSHITELRRLRGDSEAAGN